MKMSSSRIVIPDTSPDKLQLVINVIDIQGSPQGSLLALTLIKQPNRETARLGTKHLEVNNQLAASIGHHEYTKVLKLVKNICKTKMCKK